MTSPRIVDEGASRSDRPNLVGAESPQAPSVTVKSPDQEPISNSASPTKADPTFMQNHLALKRNLSAAKSANQSSLSRTFSLISDSSHDSTASTSGQPGDSLTGISEEIHKCSLFHSPSAATDRSDDSDATLKSVKSHQSVSAIGQVQFGSLRLHTVDEDIKPQPPSHNFKPDCLRSGSVILVSEISSTRFFGCDTIIVDMKPEINFRGIRDVPPGAHFIYAGSLLSTSMRNGFWIITKQTDGYGDIIVKHWDRHDEKLTEQVSKVETMFQKEAVPEIFHTLTPYPQAEVASQFVSHERKGSGSEEGLRATDPLMWHRLTFAIKGAMLTRITGHPWNEWQVDSADDYKPSVVHLSEAERREIFCRREVVLTFIFDRDVRTFSDNAVGRERTEQALDPSTYIETLIDCRCTDGDEVEVVGELQFCYLTGMFLGNIACMEQWAHLIKILFKAYHLIMVRPRLFRQIIQTVHAQFMFDEDGVDDSIFDHDSNLHNDLRLIFTKFKSRLNEQLLSLGEALTSEQQAVGNAFESLKAWLWKWEWDLRGNYVRSGKVQLEDGESVDVEMEELEDEDERALLGRSKGEKKATRSRRNSRLKWKFAL